MRFGRSQYRFWRGLVLLLALLPARGARAAPTVGTSLQAVHLSDSWDRPLDASRLGGTPILLLYEDKTAATQNQVLKDELATLARGDAYRGRVALLAVADVQAYDFWPARPFVKDALQRESVRLQTDIFCDWDGGMRRTLGLKRGTSTVVLYGREGAALFSFEGRLPKTKREELFALLKRELGR